MLALLVVAAATLSGCATYQTPGAGVDVGTLSRADGDIADLMKREPAATFPARLAVARVQANGYVTRNAPCYGKGQFCLVTTRDVESEQDFERLNKLPLMAGVAPLNRLLVSPELRSLRDLRLGAATLKTDLLLVYTIDTRFQVESTDIGPLGVISLGFLPNKKARVMSTASAVLIDVRTGFIHGAAETTATEQQRASTWSTESAIENARIKAESDAFQQLMNEFETLWRGIAKAQAQAPARTGT